MMQDVALAPELRVREQVDLVRSYYASPLSVSAALELTNTVAIADRSYGKLSGGQKRQAQFALAVCGRPALLFLDEPTVGMDIQARQTLWKVLRDLVKDGASVVLTTHYLEEAEALADRVAIIASGRLVASGTVTEIRALAGRKRISCITALDAAEIASWPGVDSVSREQERLQITSATADATVRRLITTDTQLLDLEVHRAGLAEAFSHITRDTAH
jgi:ABC-type multidrug transport system ATPase subunit